MIFAIYDDVNLKNGYMNRDAVLERDRARCLSLESLGTSADTFITEIKVGSNARELFKTLKPDHVKAPSTMRSLR